MKRSKNSFLSSHSQNSNELNSTGKLGIDPFYQTQLHHTDSYDKLSNSFAQTYDHSFNPNVTYADAYSAFSDGSEMGGLNHTMSMVSLQSLGSSNHSQKGNFSSRKTASRRRRSSLKMGNIRKRQPKEGRGGCFEIDLDRIMNMEDGRTTVMIKNIPNKYDMKQMLKEINERHKDRFDFFYLPIDYGNHCNVGYAFINFLHAAFILDFYRDYNGKGWPNYNSEKICDLKYGRI